MQLRWLSYSRYTPANKTVSDHDMSCEEAISRQSADLRLNRLKKGPYTVRAANNLDRIRTHYHQITNLQCQQYKNMWDENEIKLSF
jgi:hypothetical protein